MSEPSESPNDVVAHALAEQMAAALARGSGRARWLRDPPSVAMLALGELVAGRFAVERFVARGGMGEIYLALDRERGRRMAIKTVLSTQGDDVRAIRRLIREVGLASRVRHPNVCRVHGAGIHATSSRDVVHFMVMDFVDGPSLRAWRRAAEPSVSRALQVARQILLGLDAVHTAGLIHGDLKSDNVLIEDDAGDPRAILVDFGLSLRLDGSERPTGVMRSGSFGYMAPEQLAGGAIAAHTDIFSFGVVLFELLTGELPYPLAEGAGPPAQWREGEGARAPVFPACHDGLPSGVAALVARCLHHEPAERFASARETLEALEALAARETAP